MKLLYCPKCQDVKKLQYEHRECKCGASWGYYLKDGLHAVVGGECVPLGIDSSPKSSFAYAYRTRKWAGISFRAFVIGPNCKTIERMEDK